MTNVITLAIAQMFAMSGITVVVLMGGIVGAEIAPGPSWATAPISIAIVAMALTTIPASLLTRRIGRRNGFIVGALVGVCGGSVAALGVVQSSFLVFCGGAVLLGATMAFTQQYRFAAAESVAPEHMGRAVSYVLIGSLVAAILGPQIALVSRSWIASAPYAGSFLAIGGLYLIAIGVLARLHLPAPSRAVAHGAGITLGELLAHPQFRTAAFAGVVAYAVMSFIMTAAPVSMHVMDHHSVETATWVIQSHVLAMYLPSLISGRLIAQFGERKVMLWGGALISACVAVSLMGHQVMHYWWGLVLLGAGWNLLFVAGTTLLGHTFRGADRHRAQALNDFTVFGSQACASLLAGFAVQQFGWQMLNLATLPLIAGMLIAAGRLRNERAAQRLAADRGD